MRKNQAEFHAPQDARRARATGLMAGLAALGAALGLSLAQPAAAQDAAAWPLSCEARSCTVQRSLDDAASGKRMATVMVGANRDTSDMILGIAVPLGSALAPGARILPKGAPAEAMLPVNFEVCFPDGCRAMLRLSPEKLQDLIAPGEFELRFFSYGNPKPLAMKVPLTGLAEALPGLKEAAAKAE